VVPRVHADRTVAQLYPRDETDSLLARLASGADTAHLMVLEGFLQQGKHREMLALRSLDTGQIVLRLSRGANNAVTVLQISAPLSAFQALNVALCLARHGDRPRNVHRI